MTTQKAVVLVLLFLASGFETWTVWDTREEPWGTHWKRSWLFLGAWLLVLLLMD